MKPVSMLACAALLCASSAHAANPLKELQSARGGVVVEYERAVAGADEFARLPGTDAVVVALAEGTPDATGRVVATAYADALRTLLPQATLAAGHAQPPAPGYLVEVGLSSVSKTVEGSEEVYASRQTGTACKVQPDGSVVCNDVGSAPISVGTRPTAETQNTIRTVIRSYRIDAGGARTVVFEDAYSVNYLGELCRNEVAAAATVATALGKDALSAKPLNIRLHSTPKLMQCDHK